jgi:tripartite-type tricarboxylate transporter receptor subunit TctC
VKEVAIRQSNREVVVMRKTLSIIIISTILILSVAFLSFAADYPTKAITMINPNAPGGQFDVIGRAFASTAERLLGKPVVVVNKPGAGNLVGGLAGAQAAPDGYTLTMIATGLTNGIEWETANGRKPPVTRHDFTALGTLVLNFPIVLVPYDSPWKTLTDMINDCKAKPNYYAFSSGGLYGGSHMPAEVFMKAARITARHVPYQGGGPSLIALVGKHVDFATNFLPACLSLIKGNKLRALAVQTDTRLKVLPDVPTVKELGIDAEYSNWIGMAIPKKTPKDIVDKVGEMMVRVTKDKSFIDTVETTGDDVTFMDGEKLTKMWDIESERIGKLMAELVKEASKK